MRSSSKKRGKFEFVISLSDSSLSPLFLSVTHSLNLSLSLSFSFSSPFFLIFINPFYFPFAVYIYIYVCVCVCVCACTQANTRTFMRVFLTRDFFYEVPGIQEWGKLMIPFAWWEHGSIRKGGANGPFLSSPLRPRSALLMAVVSSK